MEICRHIGGWIRRLDRGAGLPREDARVYGDREADLATEALGERVLELAAQPALELRAGEVVRHRDDRGVAVPADGLADADPRLLVRLALPDDALPGGREVGVVVHRSVPLFRRRVPWPVGPRS